MISVILNNNIIRRIKRGATRRQQNAERIKAENLRNDKGSSDYQTHYWGLVGETAFSLVTGLVQPTKVDEIDLYDFVLPDLRTIDVKHTKWKNGTLMLGPRAAGNHSRLADIYVLSVGVPPVIDVVGFIDGETLYNHYEPHPAIKKYKRWLPQDRLIPIEELMKLL